MPVETNLYVSLWNKYRPMILQLMSAASQGPQQYKLFPHEFKSVGEKAKLTYTFTLEASKGKALNNIKTSAAARDLLQVLQQSKRAMQLMNESTFVLNLDKHFVFHVTRKEMPIEIPAEEQKA